MRIVRVFIFWVYFGFGNDDELPRHCDTRKVAFHGIEHEMPQWLAVSESQKFKPIGILV
jgi:hypothetical protein